MEEEWAEIEGTNGDYLVSNYGKVFNKRTNRLVGHKSTLGYMEVSINGRNHYIHRYQNNEITKERMKDSNRGKIEAANKAKRKRVAKYTASGEYIREYPSATEAAKAIGCARTSVAKCCRGCVKTLKGFVWKYVS